MLTNQNLLALVKLFNDAGHEIRLVGGCVRDHLMGKTPKDIDLCTTATPMQMLELPCKNIATGLQHGTITFLVGDDAFEVTTLRVDVACDGRHAEVEYTTSFQADAARRDLTINAMSMDMDGNVFDYFNGQEDLKNGVVRFVGNADDRLHEDYLRLMRWVRFHDKFNVTPRVDFDTVRVCQKHASALAEKVSVERVWMELSQMLKSKNCVFLTWLLDECGVLDEFNLFRLQSSFDGTDVVTKFWLMGNHNPDLGKDFKLTNDQMKQLDWLNKFFSDENYDNRFQYAKLSLVDGVPLDWVVSAMNADNQPVMVDFLVNWTVPVFPVRGQDLLDRGVKAGKEVGHKLKDMKKAWVASDFTMTKDELLA